MTETTTEQPLTTIPAEATAILESYHLAQTYASQGKECASKAVAEALRCGAMLLTQKQYVGHGKFEKWCKTYLPELSDSNRKDWMRLAKRVRPADLPDAPAVPALTDAKPVVDDVAAAVAQAPSLRQAYKAILLPTAQKRKVGKVMKVRVNVIDVINRFRGHKLIAPLLAEDGELSLVMNATLLKQALEPLAKLYERLK